MRRLYPPPVPIVPRPGTLRGRWLARQRADDSEGRFNERVFSLQFDPLNTGETQSIVQAVTSCGGRFVRCLDMRASMQTSLTPTGTEWQLLNLRVQINGANDLIGQPTDVSNAATFQTLFASTPRRPSPSGPSNQLAAPPLVWLSPPYFRAGDFITATVTYPFIGEGAPVLTANLSFRWIDDALWQELWNRDVRAARGAA